jgi:hypothetical protein
MSAILIENLQKKWAPVIDHPDLPKIEDKFRRSTLAVMLENQENSLNEERQMLTETPGSVTANVDKYDPVLIGMVRRAMPQLIAYDICGVQPMTMPTGLIFALTSRYTDRNGAEALFNEANGFSGAYTTNPGDLTSVGTSPTDDGDNGLDPWASNAPGNFTAAAGMTAAVAEAVNPAEMSFKIEKKSVTAKSRALKAEYTVELAQDLKAVHGLDAEGELSNILSNQITADINREVVRSIYKIAKTGAQEATTAGTFDLDVDANGRWSVERFKGLMFQIERDANRIAQTTRLGRGNFILCSADVASALDMAGKLDIGPALAGNNLMVDESSTTFAGVLNGKYKVFVDPYMATVAGSTVADQFCLVGLRGGSPFAAGLFYCPYVPLSLMRAVDPSTFQPKIGFKTRYGLISHPLSGDGDTMAAQSNYFFRLMRVSNIA